MTPISIYAINVGSCIFQHFPQNVGIGAAHIFYRGYVLFQIASGLFSISAMINFIMMEQLWK